MAKTEHINNQSGHTGQEVKRTQFFLLKLFKYFQAWLTQFWQTFPPSMAFTLQYFPSSFTAFSALRNMFLWVSADNANLEGRLIVKLVSSLTVLELTKQENTLLCVCTETAQS